MHVVNIEKENIFPAQNIEGILIFQVKKETRYFSWTPVNWENIVGIYSNIYLQTQMLPKFLIYCLLKSTII